MKFTKMSLVAALLIGSSAFALDNVKVSGDFKVNYATADMETSLLGTTNKGLFDKDTSAADISASLDVTADLFKNDLVSISAGAGATAVGTLGLENNFVSGVWSSAHTPKNLGANGSTYPANVQNAFWVDEAWLAVSAGKTTVKLGRMELDTPLAFTESWGSAKNTFEAAVLINQDIPDTTLVGAYVGNGNGTEGFGIASENVLAGAGLAIAPIVNEKGSFNTYGSDGAYAAGLINNSFKPLTVQAWYYDVTRVAEAYWLQADLACQKVPGLMAGAQYSNINVNNSVVVNGTSPLAGKADVESDVYAVMLGYEMKDMMTAKVAYSETDDKHSVGFNTATSTGASKLYTEAWWNYGYVTAADTKTLNVSVTSPVNGMFDLGIYYTDADQGTVGGNVDMTEITATVGKDFGPLNATLAYINTKADDQNIKAFATKGSSYNMVQAYLTVNF
jgi:hypothetical protein